MAGETVEHVQDILTQMYGVALKIDHIGNVVGKNLPLVGEEITGEGGRLRGLLESLQDKLTELDVDEGGPT